MSDTVGPPRSTKLSKARLSHKFLAEKEKPSMVPVARGLTLHGVRNECVLAELP